MQRQGDLGAPRKIEPHRKGRRLHKPALVPTLCRVFIHQQLPEWRKSGLFPPGTTVALGGPAFVKIEMIATPDRRVPDVDLAPYKKGRVYEVPSVLAALLVCEGWARPLPPRLTAPGPVYTK